MQKLILKGFSIPEKFLWLKKVGGIESVEMLKTFNCGIGLILVVKAKESQCVTNFFEKKKILIPLSLAKFQKEKETKNNLNKKKFGKWDLT